MVIKVVTWNINRRKNQKVLSYLTGEISPDIALVQEIFYPNSQIVEGKLLWRKIQDRNFGSGIITKEFPVKEIQFNNSYPGAIIVGDVNFPEGDTLTVISVYGLMFNDTYVTATLHRMLSDLTPLLTGKMGKRKIIIGGDFNADRQYDKYHPSEPSHKIFFDRLEDFGLIDCLSKFHMPPVQTLRHNKSLSFPWQDDYIYISKDLEDKLVDSYVIDNNEVRSLSDHNPVVAVLKFD